MIAGATPSVRVDGIMDFAIWAQEHGFLKGVGALYDCAPRLAHSKRSEEVIGRYITQDALQ